MSEDVYLQRVRTRHRAMDVYFGDERCLEDAECYDEQDYPIGEESAIGGFCPHVLKAATICPACSRMDYKTESWPEADWVLYPCSVIRDLEAGALDGES